MGPLLMLLWAGTSILIAGRPVDVGRPVVLWSDAEGFNGYAKTCSESAYAATSKCCTSSFRRYGDRKGIKRRTLDELRSVVSQLVLHLDGCVNSRSCFYSMHDTPRPDGGCGLSSHFMIDADGTIYQTLDLLESAWHAEQSNGISVGVEICNRGDAGRNELGRLPADYLTRPVKEIVVNGRTIRAFDFRPEQYESVIALSRALVRQLPGIKPVYPERDGKPLLETLPDPSRFRGIVGHLHVDVQRRKWDPGAFDWLRLRSGLNGYHLPVTVGSFAALPQERASLYAAAKAVFRNVEERSTGFFPLAPGRLWHSGVHMRGPAGQPVHAPARGRLMAARLTSDGSGRSFVLVRHQAEIEGAPFVYYSLLAHLASLTVTDRSPVGWVRDLALDKNEAVLRDLRAGRVALMDRAVEAGDVLGFLERFSRGSEQGVEVHFEILSATRLPGAPGRTFRFIEAGADGPFARRGALVAPPDEDKDGQLTAEELRAFFRQEDLARRQSFRHLAVRHQHEWGDHTGERPLVAAPELSQLPEAERRRLFRTALAPYRFWSDRVSRHTGLPSNQTAYSYHPIVFLLALAAEAERLEIRWPPRSPMVDRELEPAPLPPGAFSSWTSARPDVIEPPIFGPVVNAEVLPRRRADIPLIVLPSAQR